MFDIHPDAIVNAKQICEQCPVIIHCRIWAHETHQEYGVWGGQLMQLRNAGHRPRSDITRKCLACDNRVSGRTKVCSDACRHKRDNERKTRQRLGKIIT